MCNEYPPYGRTGGIGNVTRALAEGFAGAGHHVSVLGYGRESSESLRSGVRVVILRSSRLRGGAWILNRWRIYEWLRKRARVGEIDIVEVPEYEGLLPFRLRCPVVVRLHGSSSLLRSHSGGKAHHRLWLCERHTLLHNRQWIAVSRYIRSATISLFDVVPESCTVIYNPVPPHHDGVPVPCPPDLRFVLYAGSVRADKGAHVLAEAARTFLEVFPKMALVYVGGLVTEGGRRADAAIRDILGESLAARVRFVGAVDHDTVLGWMKMATVVALPSRMESFGLTAIEAMSCGTPVVYTSAGAGPELIEDGVSGLLADPSNAEDVAGKILTLLKNGQLRNELAANALAVARTRFSLKRSLDETLAFYNSAILAWQAGKRGEFA